MTRPASDRSDLEYQVRDFLTAAASPALQAACDILLINANDLAVGGPRHGIVLVSIEANQSFDEAMSCVSARMSVEGSQVATELVPTFVEYVKPIIAEMKARIPAGRKPTEDEQAIMVASMIRREHQEEFGPVFSRALVNNIGLGADFLGHSLLKFGIETRQRHVAATTGVLEYDAMVKALERTQVFAPRARVVLCDQCWNLEVAFGRHAGTLAKCTKCGAGVSTMSLLFPTAEFQRLKLDSIDLPLFAAAFLRHKAMLPTSIAACRTYSEPTQGEVDVAIDELGVAIEIKVFNSPATFNEQKVENEAPNLAKQLHRYAQYGFKRIILLTNILQPAAEKLAKAAQSSIEELKPVKIEVYGSPFAFIRTRLEQLGAALQEAVGGRLERSLGFEGNRSKGATA